MERWKNKSLEGLDAQKFAKNSGTYLVLGAALLAMTFFGVCDPSGGLTGPKGTAATVGGEDISRQEFSRYYNYELRLRQQQMGEAFDAAALKLADSVLNRLVNQRILYLSSVRMGLKASDADIIDAILENENFQNDQKKFDEEVFKNFLRYNGYTEASFREQLRRDLTVQKMQNFLLSNTYVSSKAVELEYQLSETKIDVEYLKIDPKKIKAEPSPAEVTEFQNSDVGKDRIKKYYEGNNSEFNKKERVKARHILVQYKGARNAAAAAENRTEEQAQKRAEEILAQVKADGADFAAIAKKETDEPSGKNTGGDLGFFTKEDIEFSEAAFGMAKGEIKGPVKSPFGFHIIKVEDKQAASEKSLEQATAEIAKKLLLQDRRPKLAEEKSKAILEKLKSGDAAQNLLTEVDVKWQTTGEFATNARFIPGLGSDEKLQTAVLGLKEVGSLHPEVVDVRGNKYILRLKTRKKADMEKLDEAKRKQLASTAQLSEGYALFSAIRSQAEDNWKEKVWKNPEYLELDQPREDNTGS